MPKNSATEDSRFAAKLLFQFRVDSGDTPSVMRRCEERIILIHAPTAKKALAAAKRRGRSAQHNYVNDAGRKVYFEFVGLMDLLHLGVECEEDEVWYDITHRKLPMERADSILPPENQLNAIRTDGV